MAMAGVAFRDHPGARHRKFRAWPILRATYVNQAGMTSSRSTPIKVYLAARKSRAPRLATK
jgi:hypothetical protein